MARAARWMTAVALATALAGCQPRPAGPSPAPASAPALRVHSEMDGTSNLAGRQSELIGRMCRVQFRRDALGLAGAAPLSPEADSSGGRPVFLSGRVHGLDDRWLVLRTARGTVHIPVGMILLIELEESP